MKYIIDRELGRGSFGIVYEAHDLIGNRYALKSVAGQDPLCANLLRKQFDFLSSVDHKRIVKAMDFDLDGAEGPILVTEMVDGVDMRAYVESHGMDQLPLIVAKVIDALRYLHGLGRLHGDLKPDSILVYEENGSPEVKLIDAGLDVGEGNALPTLAGTPLYMAPEILRNLKAGGESDLYSLGVSLYEIITGDIPFEGKDQQEVFRKHLEYKPPPPSSINPDIDPAWDAFVANLIEKEPLLRYGDADQAGLDLEDVAGRPGLYLENLMPPRSTPLVARRDEIAGARSLLVPPGGKGVLMVGDHGCGMSRLLDRIGASAKLLGQRVFAVSLNEGMPAIAQIVEVVRGTQSESVESQDAVISEEPVGETACFGEILGSFRSGLQPDREHLLIVDGGEAMEPDELRLLGALSVEMKGRLGVLVGYQAEEAGAKELPESDSFVKIKIPPLTARDVERVISWHFGTRTLPSELAEELYHATGGNPGLLALTIEHLWNIGSLSFVRKNKTVQLAWDGGLEVPSSVKSIVHEKLAHLSEQAMRVLKVLFVGGGEMETDLLSRWVESDTLYAALQELRGRGLVEPAGGWVRLSMRKESLEEALGAGIAADEIEQISLGMAGILESRIRGAYDHYRLGLLYLQGGRRDSAFGYLSDAGDRFSRFSIRDALLAYRKALTCKVDPGLFASVSEKIGDLKLEQGDLESAISHFERAAVERSSSLRKLGWVRGLKGEYQESVEILKRCEQAATAVGDTVETARIRSDLGYIYALQSRKDLSLEALDEAREVFEKNSMYLEAGVASNRTAYMEWKAGDLRRAARVWTTAIDYFEQAGDTKRAAICLMSLGLCHRKTMNFAEAEHCFKTALGVFADIGAMGEKAFCQQNYAILLLEQGDLTKATDLAREALAAGSLLGWHSPLVTSTMLLGALSLEAGNWQEAESRLSDLLNAEGALDAFQKAMLKRYLALAACMSGRIDEAYGLAEESYVLAGEAQDSEGVGQAMLAEGSALLEAGDCEGAAEAARKALKTLTSSSSMLLANEARRLLGEAMCCLGRLEEGTSMLLAAKQGLEAVPRSLYMARVLRGLAMACFMEGDYDSSSSYLRKSLEISRTAGGRYDYACALLLGGRHALGHGNLLRARHYLLEAARIFNALKIEDAYDKAVSEMEKVPSGDIEVKAVSSLSKISQTLNSSHDLTTVLNRAMDLAIEYLGAERGVIMLEDEGTGELATFAERAMDQESLEDVISVSRSIVESVRKTKESVIAGDATKDPRFKHSRSVKTQNIMSVMCVPLTMEDNLLGIIYVDSRDISSGFSGLEKSFVEAFANQVSLAIVNARLVGRLYDDVANLRVKAEEKYSFENVIGPGKRMQEVFRRVDKAARSDLRILITGENGTGKQVIASLVHSQSDRSDRQMIQVNCAAISKDLLESELFGIEKNVATGVSPRSGYFERADGGTIFLDEIGDMPETTQMKVLRVLSEHEFERVGGSKIIKVDVRVISATNKDLKKLVEKGDFRKDLYYRLNGMRIHIPALRERKEDLPYLVDHFLGKYAEANQKPNLVMSREARALLMRYWWPGNVRELETCIQHAVVKADGDKILPEHLHDEVLDNLRSQDPIIQLETGHHSLPDAVARLERRMIEEALRQNKGVKTIAARHLGIHEATLRKKMKKLGLEST